MHDRAVPENCVESRAFGFHRPCRDVLGYQAKKTVKRVAWSGLVLGLLEVAKAALIGV